MRFLSYTHKGRASFGAVTEAGVVDLGARHKDLIGLRAAIGADRLAELAGEAADAKADMALADIELVS